MKNCNTLKINGKKLNDALKDRGETLGEWGKLIGKSTGYFSACGKSGVISTTSWELLKVKLKDMGMGFSKAEEDEIVIKDKPTEVAKEYEVAVDDDGNKVTVTVYHNGVALGSSYGYKYYDGTKGWLQAVSYAIHMLYKNEYEI